MHAVDTCSKPQTLESMSYTCISYFWKPFPFVEYTQIVYLLLLTLHASQPHTHTHTHTATPPEFHTITHIEICIICCWNTILFPDLTPQLLDHLLNAVLFLKVASGGSYQVSLEIPIFSSLSLPAGAWFLCILYVFPPTHTPTGRYNTYLAFLETVNLIILLHADKVSWWLVSCITTCL